MRQHFRNSPWTYHLDHLVMESFATRDAAESAEREAIEALSPLMNCMFNGGHKTRWIVPVHDQAPGRAHT